jgi:hypothetical protein
MYIQISKGAKQMTATYSVREQESQESNVNPAHKSEVVTIFKTYEAATDFVAANYRKNGYGRLYVSED